MTIRNISLGLLFLAGCATFAIILITIIYGTIAITDKKRKQKRNKKRLLRKETDS